MARRFTVRTYLYGLIAVAMLPLVLLLGLVVSHKYKEQRDAARAEVRLLADHTGRAFEAALADLHTTLERLAGNPVLQAAHPDDARVALGLAHDLRHELTVIVLTDAIGKTVAVAGGAPGDERAVLHPDPLPPDARPRRPLPLTRLPSSGRWHAVLTVNLTRDHAVVGQLYAAVDLVQLSHQLLDPAAGDRTRGVLACDGRILLHTPDPERFVGTPSRLAPPPAPAAPGSPAAAGPDLARRYIEIVPIAELGCSGFATVPAAELGATARQALAENALLLIVACTGLLLLVRTVGRRLVGAIEALTETVRRQAGGDTRVVALEAGPAEVAATARAFNAMVDARRETEAALRRSEAFFRSVFDDGGGAVLITGSSRRVMQANARCQELLGYSLDELRQRSLADLVHPDDRPAAEHRWEQLRRGESSRFDAEERFFRGDGSVIDVAVAVNCIRDAHGRLEFVVSQLFDITTRKAALARLRESEQRLALALHGGGLGMWDWNVTANSLQVDGRFAAMLGVEAEDCERRPGLFTSLVHPDDREVFRAGLLAHVDGSADLYESEHRMVRPDGSVWWVLDRGLVTSRDPQGRALRMVGTIRDITIRKQAELALDAEKRRFESLLQSLDGIVWEFDAAARRFTFVSQQSQSILGYPPARWLEEKDFWVAHLHPDDRAWAPAFCRTEIDAVRAHRLIYRMIAADGRIVWLQDSATVSSGEDGRPANVRGVMVDITARKQAENSAQQHAELLQAILEHMPVLVVFFHHDGRPTYVNRAATATLGLAPADLGPDTLARLLPDAAARDAHLAHVFRADGSWHEVTLRTADGRTRLATWAHVRVPDGSLVGIGQDITDLREAELERERFNRKLLDAQKLESLGVLAGGIAHDFNNLLTGVLGHASLARLELPPDASVLECIAEIEKAAMQAAELCKQMLAYSGKGRFEVRPLDLSRLVEQTISLLQISVSKRVELQLRLDYALPAIEADAAQMRQILMNFVINASEAIEGNGTVVITTGSMQASREYLASTHLSPDLPAGNYVFLEVADNGCGMSAETLARVFDPFYTTKFTGRGLGLAAVLGIVRGHRGAIHVESQPGVGSRFRVLFPPGERPAALPAAPAPVAASPRRDRGTILVVDDEETVRTVSARLLRNLGFECVLAHDGRDGVARLRNMSPPPAGILLDLTMPVMDGIATLKAIRELPAPPRVILMTGYSEQEASLRYGDHGPDGFLQKPFSAESLDAVLSSLPRPG